MKRAAIYCRMRTSEQKDSPERQKSLILPHCQRKGHEVVGTYQDDGLRGWDDTRPEFQRLLKDAQNGRFEVIVIDELSRLSREDPIDFLATVARPLRQVGVVVETVDDGRQHTWDSDDIGSLLLGFINQHKASQESVTLGRRTATGQARRAREDALFTGAPPYGLNYRRNSNGERVGYAHGDPEDVALVRRIFDSYLHRDLSVDAIVGELNREGIPSPKGARWGKNTVGRILRNPVYAGKYVWGRVSQGRYWRVVGEEVVRSATKSSETRPRDEWIVLPGDHEPLISPEEFEQVQARLMANRSRTSRARKRAEYPLSGLLICSDCGAPLYGTSTKSGGIMHAAYRCGANMSNGNCAPRTVRERVILDALVEVLREEFQDPENFAQLRATLREEQGDGDAEREHKSRQRKAAKIRRQIADSRRKLIHVPADMMADAVAEIRRMEQELAEPESHARPARVSLESLAANVDRLSEMVELADPETLRVLLRETIEKMDMEFDTVKKRRITRYPLVGGVIQLRSVDSSHCGPAAV